MANLTEQQTFDAAVYELAITDPVMGGPGGVDNQPHQNLTNRTAWLKQQVDALIAAGVTAADITAAINAHLAATDPHPQYTTDAEVLVLIAANAPAAPVASVVGKTGAVTLVKSDVGLSTVDNTSDALKPVSAAQGAALALKEDKSNRNATNGYAGLLGGKISKTQIPVSDALHVQHQVAQGSNGGTTVVGQNIRPLNTVLKNTIAGASLSGNQITLPVGTYRVTARSGVYDAGSHQAWLFNVSASAVQMIGTSEAEFEPIYASVSYSEIIGFMTLTAPGTFRLEHYVQKGYISQGLGVNTGSGGANVYADVLIEKEG